MKTHVNRFGWLMVAMVATFSSILLSTTALAVPPPNSQPFETRLNFGASQNPLNASALWDTTQIQGATTTAFRSTGDGSLRVDPEYQSWQSIDRSTMKFNISPGGTGTYEFWVQVYPEGIYGKFLIKIRGTLREVSRQETVSPATVKYTGTAQIVETKGWAVQGWTLSGGTVEACGEFTRDVFDTCPKSILFPMDQTRHPRRDVKGFHILGTLVIPSSPPAATLAPAPTVKSASTTKQIVSAGIEALEEAGPEVTDEEIDAVLTEMEEAVGIRRRGGK